jgi:rhodanese-related sulfurtransferase
MHAHRRRSGLVVALVLAGAACSSSSSSSSATTSATTSAANVTTTAAGATTTAGATTAYQLLDANAAAKLVKNPPKGMLILDVRTPAEFAAGHLLSAVVLDIQDPAFNDAVARLDPQRPYLVYCSTGVRSAQAVAYLKQQHFTVVYELKGGITAWLAAGQVTVPG